MTIDLTQFHESFYEESFEAIASMEDALLQLNIGMPDPATVNTIFRVAHSIKGGAAAFGFNEITSFTHTLETLLDELRAQRMQVTQQISDLLLKSVDVLRDMLRAQQSGKAVDAQAVADLQFDLELVVAQKSSAPAPAPAPATPRPAEQAVKFVGAAGGGSSSIRVSIEKLDELMNNVGELVITQSMLSQLGNAFHGPQGERLRAGLMQLERSVRELQENVMRVRMVPISFVFSRFPRMVRDLSQRLGKSVELKMTGGETEIDKTVLEKIGDPLVHLVRNGIDHGIETREVRLARGKPETGTLHLHACHRGGNITVEVSEDGAGLKREKILAKAKSRNLVAPDVELTDAQVNELILLPGFSTSDQATDVSGRGVGMDVVRRNIEELGGTVEIRSEEGKGSRFIINLPLTLAIVDGQTISVDGECYIVPLTAIVESLQLRPGMIQPVVGRGEVLSFRGEYLPVLRLREVFGRGPGARDNSGLVMVVEGDGRRVGICVDELMGQQQVVVKTLETNYQRVDGVAGAAILGDGSVALILDIAGLSRRLVGRVAA